MKKKKTTKCKKSFIAEAVIPYVANTFSFSFEGMLDNIIQGDNLRILKLIPDNSINLIITSPPYFKQRDYGGGIGNERTVEEYIENLVLVFSECFRILKDDGSIVFNLGDKYLEGSLQLIPFRFAIEVLKTFSVKLVNNITWVKLNPTPRQYQKRLVSSTEPFFHFVKTEEYYYNLTEYMTSNGTKSKRPNGDNIGKKYFDLIENSDLTLEQKKMALCELQEVIEEVKNGWLTRSLEQNLPYDLNYPGKITPAKLKSSFLYLLDQIQNHNKSSETYLLFLFAKLIEFREQKQISLAKPTNLPISTIIDYLRQHFESRYSVHGASRLPTLAVYSIYQCMVKELKRFEGKILMPLEEHTSSDRSSGRVGDIEVRDSNGNVFEAVEIKHGIPVNTQLVRDSYEKFKAHPIQRYYLLSTADVDSSDIENLTEEVSRILKIHGCQVIINGIYPSLKYYLRLLHNTYDFIDNYVENLKKDKTIKYEHKLKWNEIVSSRV